MNNEAPKDTQTLDAGETLWLDGQIAEILDGAMVDQEQTLFRVHELIGLGSLQGHCAESFCAARKSTVKIWPRGASEAMTKRLALEVERLQHEARQQQFALSEQGLMSDRRHRDRDALVSAQIKSGIADAAKSQGILRHWLYRFFGR